MSSVPSLSGPKTAVVARLRTVQLMGPAGRLESVLNEGAPEARAAALVCHPHPMGGGTMHNKVVYHAMKVLNSAEFGLGLPVLRFNFRGTGLSDGLHDGRAEAEDVRAAVDWLASEFGRGILAVGFSFGAAMALLACCGDSRVKAVAALGLPTHAAGRDYHYGFLDRCTMPKLFLSGDRDEFAPAESLKHVFSNAAEPKTLVLVPGADHFFTSQLDSMQVELQRWAKEQLL